MREPFFCIIHADAWDFDADMPMGAIHDIGVAPTEEEALIFAQDVAPDCLRQFCSGYVYVTTHLGQLVAIVYPEEPCQELCHVKRIIARPIPTAA